MTDTAAPLVEVDGLVVSVRRAGGAVRLVDEVSFSIGRGESYGLVGQSGSGKSMTAMAMMGLLRRAREMRVTGAVRLAGRDLLGLTSREMSDVRGAEISMVFQDPMSSLNPAYTVGEQIAETLRRHRGMSRREARREAVEALKLVEIPGAERRVSAYPHEFSGGMRQRVMLAIAVACRPKVLIADEATTALDVTVQAQVLGLLRRLQEDLGMAVLFITHDLSVLADIADRVGVMYAGQLVEEASVFDVFERTSHPYSSALLRSSPEYRGLAGASLLPTSHQIADTGCRFRPRCGFATGRCEQDVVLAAVPGESAHTSRCARVSEIRIPTGMDLWDELEKGTDDKRSAAGSNA